MAEQSPDRETTYEDDLAFLEQQPDLFMCGPYLWKGDGTLPPEAAKEARRYVEWVQAREKEELGDQPDAPAVEIERLAEELSTGLKAKGRWGR